MFKYINVTKLLGRKQTNIKQMFVQEIHEKNPKKRENFYDFDLMMMVDEP